MERQSLPRSAAVRVCLRSLIVLAAIATVLLGCEAPRAVGIQTPTRQPRSAPAATRVAAPTLAVESVDASRCVDYLGLVVSADTQEVEAALNSYRCGSLYVDSPGRYPPADPVLATTPGRPLRLKVDNAAGEVPVAVEVRLYSGAGQAGLFLRWPEDYLDGVQPLDVALLAPSPSIAYYLQVPPGVYSLVVKVAWEHQVDVFYSTSFTVEPPA